MMSKVVMSMILLLDEGYEPSSPAPTGKAPAATTQQQHDHHYDEYG
jgi:hypothetical protein